MDKKHFLKNVDWFTFEESADQKLNSFLNRIINNDQYLYLSKSEFHHACNEFYDQAIHLKTRANKEIFLKTLQQVLEAVFILKFDLNGLNEYRMWSFDSFKKQPVFFPFDELPKELKTFLTSKKNIRIDQKLDLMYKKKSENYFNPHLNFALNKNDEYELKFLFKDGFKNLLEDKKAELRDWIKFFKILELNSHQYIEVQNVQECFLFISRNRPNSQVSQIEFLVINKEYTK